MGDASGGWLMRDASGVWLTRDASGGWGGASNAARARNDTVAPACAERSKTASSQRVGAPGAAAIRYGSLPRRPSIVISKWPGSAAELSPGSRCTPTWSRAPAGTTPRQLQPAASVTTARRRSPPTVVSRIAGAAGNRKPAGSPLPTENRPAPTAVRSDQLEPGRSPRQPSALPPTRPNSRTQVGDTHGLDDGYLDAAGSGDRRVACSALLATRMPAASRPSNHQKTSPP